MSLGSDTLSYRCMPSETLAILRNRFSLRGAILWVPTLAIVYVVADSYEVIVGILIGFLFIEGMDLLRDLPGVDERWVKAGFAVLLGVASTAWLWLEVMESTAVPDLLFPVLAVAASLWLILDARADFVQGRRLDTGEEFDDLSSAEAMLVMQHASLVADELEAEPKTVDELAEACDLTVSRVEDVIDLVGQDGTIYPVDPDAAEPRYALDEQKMGLSGFGRKAAGGLTELLDRLARPFVEGF